MRPVVSVFLSLSFFLESPLPLAFPGRLCATGAPSIVVDSMQMLRRRLVPRLHAALEQVLRTWRQGATFSQPLQFDFPKRDFGKTKTVSKHAVSERSASVLGRVKTYLRSTMSQLRLNNLLILHAHKDRTDDLVIPSYLKEFVKGNERRLHVLGEFT